MQSRMTFPDRLLKPCAAAIVKPPVSLKTVGDYCFAQSQTPELNAIRGKLVLDAHANALVGFDMVTLNVRPTPAEQLLVYKWGRMRDACLQRVIEFVRSFTAPDHLLQSFWNNVAQLTDSDRINVDTLISYLASGRMTYGQFNAGRTQIDNTTANAIQIQFDGMRNIEESRTTQYANPQIGNLSRSVDPIGDALAEAIAHILFRPHRQHRR
jgi:hypothetical protein